MRNRRRNVAETDSDRYTNGYLSTNQQKQSVRFAGVSQGHEILVPKIVIAILFPLLPRRGKRGSGEMFSH